MAKAGIIQIIGARLRAVRVKRAMTQEEFGRAVGLTGSRLAQIEKAASIGVFLKVFQGLSKLTGEPIERLLVELGANANPPNEHDNIDMSTMQPVPEIPIFDLPLAAGPWAEVGQVAELRDLAQIADGRFRVRLAGDSMEPDYPNGSLVEFRSLRQGLDALEEGVDYYVQVDEKATFKRLEKAGDEVCIFRAVNRKRYPKPFDVKTGEIFS